MGSRAVVDGCRKSCPTGLSYSGPRKSVTDGKETNSTFHAVSRKVIETDLESETAIWGKRQLVLSAPQCHNSEQFSGPSRCAVQQPSALFT